MKALQPIQDNMANCSFENQTDAITHISSRQTHYIMYINIMLTNSVIKETYLDHWQSLPCRCMYRILLTVL